MQQYTEFHLFIIQKIIFTYSKNSKTSGLQRIIFNLREKMNLKKSYLFLTLSNLSIYYACKNINKLYKINTFKISASIWKDKFELIDGSYTI